MAERDILEEFLDIPTETQTFMGVSLIQFQCLAFVSFAENDLVCNEQIHSELVEALTDHLWALRGRTTHTE